MNTHIPQGWEAPTKVRFPERSKKHVKYHQDHHFGLTGLPAHVTFKVTGIIESNGLIRLQAPHFGGRPYGNGEVFVDWLDVAVWAEVIE